MSFLFRIVLLIAIVKRVTARFPLTSLTNTTDYRISVTHAFPIADNDVILVIFANEIVKDLKLHPQVIIPTDVNTYIDAIVLRVIRDTQMVRWARALPGLADEFDCDIDKTGDVYCVTQSGVGDDKLFVRKISPFGRLLWDISLPFSRGHRTFLYGNLIRHASKNALILGGSRDGRPQFVIIDPITGMFKSSVLVTSAEKHLGFETAMGDATTNSACMMTSVNDYSETLGERSRLFVHCIDLHDAHNPRTRELHSLPYPAVPHQASISMVQSGKDETCPKMFVVYQDDVKEPNVKPNPFDEPDEFANRIVVRKLCVDTLEEAPWGRGEQTQALEISVEESQLGMIPRPVRFVRRLGGVAVVFSAAKFNASRQFTISGTNVTILGTESDIFFQPQSWMLLFGWRTKPTLIPVPVHTSRERGYEFPKPFNHLVLGDVRPSENEGEMVVAGYLENFELRGSNSKGSGPPFTYSIPIPPVM